MWAFLASLVGAIPNAATSNAGLTAFAITALAYVATVWRVSRNKQILENLQKLSPEDRLPALELEMGGVRLATGISPEQWIRSRINRYYFFAFIVTVLLIAVLAVLLFIYREGSANITVDLKQSNLHTDFARRPFSYVSSPAYADDVFGNDNDDDRKLRYQYSKDGPKITLTPVLKYLDSQRRGEPVTGFFWWNDPFRWDFPSLAVKVVNNTPRNLVLSEVVFRVKTSTKDNRPVFAVHGPTYLGAASINNEGWGGISNPSLQVAVKDENKCSLFDLANSKEIVLKSRPRSDFNSANSFDQAGNLNFYIGDLVSEDLVDRTKKCSDEIIAICSDTFLCEGAGTELSNVKCIDSKPRDKCVNVNQMPPESYVSRFKKDASQFSKNKNPAIYFVRQCSNTRVCVQGRLNFVDQDGRPGTLNFSTISVLEEPGSGAPMPPSYSYDVFLAAGKSNYTQRESISQQIKPGEGDNFSIKLASDRSASFDLDMDILAVNGSVAWTGSFNIALLIPKSGAHRSEQSQDFARKK